jgi:hypothetical protein
MERKQFSGLQFIYLIKPIHSTVSWEEITLKHRREANIKKDVNFHG